MKKLSLILLVMLVLAVMLVLSACNNTCKHDDPRQIVEVEQKNPTCQESGLTAGQKCNLCGTMVTPQTVIEKTGCIGYEIGADGNYSVTGKPDVCIHPQMVIPDTYQGIPVTGISPWSFEWCQSIESIIVGDSVITIGDNAFYMCTSLESITISLSVTNIGDCAFYKCSSLTTINYVGTIEQWNKIDKAERWYLDGANYTIFCTDGQIAKDGTVTYK